MLSTSEWKSNFSDMYCKRGPNEKIFAVFQILLSRSNFSAPAKSKDGQPSTLNPCEKFRGS